MRAEALDVVLRWAQQETARVFARGLVAEMTVALGILELGALIGARDAEIGVAISERLHEHIRETGGHDLPPIVLAAREQQIDDLVRAWDLAAVPK